MTGGTERATGHGVADGADGLPAAATAAGARADGASGADEAGRGNGAGHVPVPGPASGPIAAPATGPAVGPAVVPAAGPAMGPAVAAVRRRPGAGPGATATVGPAGAAGPLCPTEPLPRTDPLSPATAPGAPPTTGRDRQAPAPYPAAAPRPAPTTGPPPTTAAAQPARASQPPARSDIRSDVRCDVLVIGGGIIGLVTAWRAAQRGLRTVLVDPAPGNGAAQVAAGMLAAVTETHFGEETLLGLNLASARRYAAFAAELTEVSGRSIGYRTCGTLAVALDSDDRAQLRDLHALQQRLGLDAEWLTGRACRRMEPLLAPGVRGGLWVGGDHQVDPRLLAAALLRAGERAGVDVRRSWAQQLTVSTGDGSAAGRTRTPGGADPAGPSDLAHPPSPAASDGARARDAQPYGTHPAGGVPLADGARATGALLADGTRVAAGQVVLAGGSLSGRLAGVPGPVVPPVRPVKGQLVRLRVPAALAAAGPFLSRTVRAVVRGGHVYLVPRADGELIVGATTEELGWDTSVTAGGLYELLRDAHEVLPGVTELELVETMAGLRPGSPDNAPLLGPTLLPGLVLATGHHRNGVLLTPITGDVMADVLTTGELPDYARPFTPLRWTAAPAGATSTTTTTGTGTGTGTTATHPPATRPGAAGGDVTAGAGTHPAAGRPGRTVAAPAPAPASDAGTARATRAYPVHTAATPATPALPSPVHPAAGSPRPADAPQEQQA